MIPSTTITVVAVGCLGFLGCLRLGKLLLALLRYPLPAPWEGVVASLGGTMCLAAITFAIAALGAGTIPVWIALGGILQILGLWELASSIRGLDCASLRPRTIPAAMAVAAAVIILLIAAAPSSKIDELYYHMLTPLRLAREGNLIFYRYPWEGAVLPQMHYPIAGTYAHALKIADAPNATSWCYAVQLGRFASQWVLIATANRWLASLIGAAAITGMLPAGTFGTAGSHAFGQLASTALILACIPGEFGRRFFPATGRIRLGAIAILAAAAAASKVTFLPLALGCSAVAIISECRRAAGGRMLLAVAFAALPALALYSPLAIWTWANSGSLFGPMLAGRFWHSAYAPGEAESVLTATLEANRTGWKDFGFYAGVGYCPLVWLGVLLAPMSSRLDRPARMYILGAIVLQSVLIWTVVQNDVRFLGGLPIAAIMFAAAGWQDRFRESKRGSRALRIGAVALLAPWLAVMAYYALPFARVSLGLQTRDDFLRRFTAFHDDFREIDSLLPADAELLVCGSRIDSVYAPRPVCFHPSDANPSRAPFLFSVDGNETLTHRFPIRDGYDIGEMIYENPRAVTVAFRRPGAENTTGTLRVYRLTPKPRDP